MSKLPVVLPVRQPLIDKNYAADINALMGNDIFLEQYIEEKFENVEISFDSEDKKGIQLYTQKGTGVNFDINKGNLKAGTGFVVVDSILWKSETVKSITPTAPLTAERWHIIYCSSLGVLSVEETTASSYDVFPIAELEAAAPVEAKGLARYKSGDPTKRAIGLAFSLAAQAAYSPGKTYARRQMAVEDGVVYVSKAAGNYNHLPSQSESYWEPMGSEGYLFAPKVYNFPEEIFGTGALGDVTLNGTGLGATATPFYGARENVTGTIEYYPEYEFNNLTISGVCYCGKSDGLSLDPVVIRVKGTLIIESGGQLNGDARGANGGAGGGGGSNIYTGGAGGAGGKSGRPIHVYANKIISKRTSGFCITTIAANGSDGGVPSIIGNQYAGGGGGGGSSSGLIIITNSLKIDFIFTTNTTVDSRGGDATYSGGIGGACGAQGNGARVLTSDGLLVGKGGFGGKLGGGGIVGSLNSGGGGGGSYGGGGAGGNFGITGLSNGSSPVISHKGLGYVIIIDQYEARSTV